MSFLKPASASAPAHATLTPLQEHITVAGANRAAPEPDRLVSRMAYTPSTVRAHLAAAPLNHVISYTEIVPVPVGLTGAITREQVEASAELAEYAADLCAPITCDQTNSGTFESTTAFRGDTTIETLSQNLREFNLCMKTTISSDSPHFTPSVFRIDADDLDALCGNQAGVEHDGTLSKFIKAGTDSVPHNILFHAIKTPTGEHSFYGISYVEKTTF